MKTLKRIIAMVLSIMIICTTNMQCLAAARAQTSTFTQTHTVNISGYGNVSATVTWKYTDGSSASFLNFVSSSYSGSHKYTDCHSKYSKVSESGDGCTYSFGIIFDDKDSYLITVSCDIYGQTSQYYSYLPSVGRIGMIE
jgi:hypothetical protein